MFDEQNRFCQKFINSLQKIPGKFSKKKKIKEVKTQKVIIEIDAS